MQIAFLRKNIIYKLVLILLLIISTYVLFRLSPTLFKPDYLLGDDFLHFWASGKLNLQGDNPFDQTKIEQLKLEQLSRKQGSTTQGTIPKSITLNPPWLIAILMPFALLDYPISRLAWLLFSIVIILISTLMLWKVYLGNQKQRWLALLAVFIFAPTISVLEKGQVTPLVLLGIAGFLYFSIVSRNDWLAGILLALTTIKPQVVFLFWIAILFWVIKQRRFAVIISASITIIGLNLITMIVNPSILWQYFGMLHNYQFSDWANPTIGSYLRFFWLGIDKFWPQFLPAIVGGLWFIYYWSRHNQLWNWDQEMPIILFISILTSTYSWTYDLVILIPAIVVAAIWIEPNWNHWTMALVMIVFIFINILDLVLHMKLDEFWFIWLAPALLIWFFLVRWISQKYRDKELITAVG